MADEPAATTDTEIERATTLVEEAVKRLGLDPAAVRMPPPPGVEKAWSLMRGSAGVAVFLRAAKEGENSPWLRVVSPIVKVDPAKEVELYKRLLELNAQGLGAVAFGLVQDRVVVVAERRTLDLEPAELEHLVNRVGVVGDHYDDQLITRFGGSRVSDLS